MSDKKLIQEQKEHFENIAGLYCEARKDLKHLCIKNFIWDYLFDFINKNNKKENVSILDAMCGNAECYDIIKNKADFTFSYAAFDYSENMVKEAQKIHPEANIFWGDITSINLAVKYDMIFLIGGLHHVYNFKETAVNNISELLNENGLFVNFEPTHNNFLLRKVRERIYKKNSFFDDNTEKAFTTPELNALMNEYGLSPVFQFYPGLLCYVLWYNPDAFPLLNIGSEKIAKTLCMWESKIWQSKLAYWLSFATFSCYRKS